MTVTEEARLLLAEAATATETHEWVRHQLMCSRDGRALGVAKAPVENRWLIWEPSRHIPPGEGGAAPTVEEMQLQREVGCDEVASCCTIGFVDFAAACLVPVASVSIAALELALKTIEQLLWGRPAVQEAVVAWWETDEEVAHDGYEFFDDWLEQHGLDEVGGEGLVAFWNDEVAGSVEEVREVLRAALARLPAE